MKFRCSRQRFTRGRNHRESFEHLIIQTKTITHQISVIISTGHLDIVKYLVAHSAEINLANVYNNTCLMISAYKGHTDVVEFLLKNDADPNQQALCGATALHYAAECGHVDICAALLDYGATLKRNEFDMTAVTTAAERTRELVVELFYGRPGLLTKEEVIRFILLCVFRKPLEDFPAFFFPSIS